jgi:citrate lyase beta subunit
MPVENTRFARRSLLFMPGDSMKKIQKAASWEVDTVILDLEDGVAQNRKDRGARDGGGGTADAGLWRARAAGAAQPCRAPGCRLRRLRRPRPGGPDGYIVPKAEDEADLRAIDRLLDAAERQFGLATGAFRLFAMIETARGVMNLKEIARATRGWRG